MCKLLLFISLLFCNFANSIEFNYQGKLVLNEKLAKGKYDFNFEIFDSKVNGNYIGEYSLTNIKVVDGVFTTKLNFNNKFNKTLANNIWMEVSVKLTTDTTNFQQLLPRQQIPVNNKVLKQIVTANNVNAIKPQSNKIRLISIETLAIDKIIEASIGKTLKDEILVETQKSSNGFDTSLLNTLTTQEYEKVSHLHDSLRELIDADLKNQIPNQFAGFTQSNGSKISDIYTIIDNQLVIDITTGSNPTETVAELENIAGITVNAVASTPSFSVVSIAASSGSLYAMSQIASLKSALPAVASVGRIKNFDKDKSSSKSIPLAPASQGIANNQAEQAMEVDAARRVFSSLNGSGIRLGVISDSLDQINGGISDSQATNDLPTGNLIIFSDSTASNVTDEGRAMMELVHDISPNLTNIGFGTAKGGEAFFASTINSLSNANMDIIVDDIIYFAEPFYQDGVIAQAVGAFVNQGGVYFSSAGNYANQSHESVFSDTDNDSFHEFNSPGGDELLDITITGGSSIRLMLQWAQPWGNATTDLDLEIRDTMNNIVWSSTTNNIGGNPLEYITVTNSGATQVFKISIKRISGNTANLTFKLLSYRSGTSFDQYTDKAAGTINPHSATFGISMGAAAWYSRDVAETFSSQGPHRRFFDAAGNAVGPFTFDKPDFMGIDGVNTSFFGSDITQDADSLPNFFGTSAAAPNAAAVAALMFTQSGGSGSLDANDIKESFRLSAIDLDSAGFDTVNGHGRINALGAVVLAKGAQSTEFYLYLNQFGDVSFDQNLFSVKDIDRFMFSSNVASATTIDVIESDLDMDPMIAVFVPAFGLRIGVDYNGGSGDDARFSSANLSGLIPHAFEVLSESDFTGNTDFTAIVNAGNQSLTDRTANLNAFGKDLDISSSLNIIGDSRYYQYTAPYNGDLMLSLTTTGFQGMLRIYDSAGGFLVHTVSIDGTEKELGFNQVVNGNAYVIQVVPDEYADTGSFMLDVEFFRQTYALSVNKLGNGNGLVTDGTAFGITCGITCAHIYAEDSTVGLDATPVAGHTFIGWSANCTVLGNGNCEILMTADTTVTAEFQAPDEMFTDGFE